MQIRTGSIDAHKRLAAYAATAGAALSAHSAPADAAVVYTDAGGLMITGPDNEIGVDINGNTFPNLILAVDTSAIVPFTSNGTTIFQYGQYNQVNVHSVVASAGLLRIANEVATGTTSGYEVALRLNLNDVIDGALIATDAASNGSLAVMHTETGTYTSFTIASGNFRGGRGFLGVNFDLAGQRHFGWLDIEVTLAADQLTLHGYAYESDPDTAILAGDKGTQLLTGDANNDGVVTADDLIAVQQNFGNVGPNGDGTDLGDANDDGTVTADDLISVQQNFGNTLVPGASSVPEPASLAMLALGAAGVVRWRRERDAG